jgi:hypothetical protein
LTENRCSAVIEQIFYQGEPMTSNPPQPDRAGAANPASPSPTVEILGRSL